MEIKAKGLQGQWDLTFAGNLKVRNNNETIIRLDDLIGTRRFCNEKNIFNNIAQQ